MRDLLDSSRLEEGLFALDRQPDDLADLSRWSSEFRRSRLAGAQRRPRRWRLS
jgi:hypothetical protein